MQKQSRIHTQRLPEATLIKLSTMNKPKGKTESKLEHQSRAGHRHTSTLIRRKVHGNGRCCLKMGQEALHAVGQSAGLLKTFFKINTAL